MEKNNKEEEQLDKLEKLKIQDVYKVEEKPKIIETEQKLKIQDVYKVEEKPKIIETEQKLEELEVQVEEQVEEKTKELKYHTQPVSIPKIHL